MHTYHLLRRTGLFSLLLCVSICALGALTASLAVAKEAAKNANEKSSVQDEANGQEAADDDSAEEADDSSDADAEASIPLAGHSDHGEAYNEGPRQNAYLMGGTGKVDFPITTENKKAQKFFTQGLGQFYGFWYYEAERSFRRVAVLDPDCAMAYWGMAQANIENKDRAKDFIKEAVEKKEDASEREQMYIDSLDKYLNDDREEKEARKKYIKALEKLIRENPDDAEARAMLAVFLWQSSRHGVPINSHQAIESLLGDVFRAQPMHPAHHFRIHLWDHEEPSQALESAAKCGQAAPTIAHMWHMPGHIYSRLKRYNDAVYQQEASARADHAHMMRDQVLPDQIHNFAHNNEWLIRNFVHLGRAKDAMSLAKNMLELPRHPKYNAFEKSGMCSCKYGRRRILQVIETFEMWEDVPDLAETMYLEPTDDNAEQAKRLRFIGIAHYAAGESREVASVIEELEQHLERIEEEAEAAGEEAAEEKREEFAKEDAEKEAEEEKAEEEKAEEEKAEDESEEEESGESDADSDEAEDGADESEEEGQDYEDEASEEDAEEKDEECTKEKEEDKKQAKKREKDIESARKKARREAEKGKRSIEHALEELQGLQLLARGKTDEAVELFKKSDIPKMRLANYYFLCGDHEKATELCEKAVKGGENEVPPLAVQVDLLRRMGKKDEAKEAFEKLRSVAGAADLDSPLLKKLEKFAADLKFPKDWRKPEELADDVGDRPKLDSIGPLRWTASPAEDWELKDHEKESVAFSEYRGQPTVVIFYLGAGCLHCVEQLHEFIPKQAEFEKVGVRMVAISTETTKEMSKAVDDFSKDGKFPIRLVANPELDVFKKYRAYDDFEKMPLHGTFLIDSKGMIRWHDISYEPFLDADFLLKETQRILNE